MDDWILVEDNVTGNTVVTISSDTEEPDYTKIRIVTTAPWAINVGVDINKGDYTTTRTETHTCILNSQLDYAEVEYTYTNTRVNNTNTVTTVALTKFIYKGEDITDTQISSIYKQ